ncbi:disulfide oxidoreductase [Bacillus horti]|uniref:Probable disulfide formation protein n=1 Tax=Caldalkalibacillus horti TaxID=77523 RepID=A0ABT9VVU0_9BACI|nr:disulfide oxidoreductase [Bacillus horti]MDQ0165114.1 disulfide bond formation protein DsbB [Bacillus horti]
MKKQGNFLSWMIATIATSGSLFFSEVMRFTPCNLCWYQRILMYPLAIILLIATVKQDRRISSYVLPFSGIGMLMSFYHYLLEKTDLFPSSDAACGLVPCTTEYINWFGFVTIPFLALVAFTLITIIHGYLWISNRKGS